MNAITQFDTAAATAVIPKFDIDRDYPNADIIVCNPSETLVYKIEFDYEMDGGDAFFTAEDTCTLVVFGEDGDLVNETVVQTPDWIHSAAMAQIEKDMIEAARLEAYEY